MKMSPVPVTLKPHVQHATPQGGFSHGWGFLLGALIFFHVAAFMYWLYLLWKSNKIPRNRSMGDLRERDKRGREWLPSARLFQQLKFPGFAKPK